MIDPPSVVIDASFLVALCAKEPKKYNIALAKMQFYIQRGYIGYAPGCLAMEALFALCRRMNDGLMTPQEHQQSVQNLHQRLQAILPPPHGDHSLVIRAEQIRVGYGCSHSADGLYIALTEELSLSGIAELVTFDVGLQKQAAANAPNVPSRSSSFDPLLLCPRLPRRGF